MALAALAALVSSFVLSLVVRATGASTVLNGLVAGVVTWIGIGATATFVTTVYEDRPYSVWLLNAGYQLVVYAIQGITFAVWQ